METDRTEPLEIELDEDAVPVCLRCFQPIDPLAHYCSHCGEASGRFTTYLPYESIPWETRIWGQAWRQIWSSGVSWWGRLFRLFMIIWQTPILLIGLLFKTSSASTDSEGKQTASSSPEKDNRIAEEPRN